MSDYISREMAKAFFTPQKGVTILTPITVTVESILATIDNIPAADVRPVVRGVWVKNGWSIRCSICGYDMPFATRNFCPNCGCAMEES
jgi:hypothetical protein